MESSEVLAHRHTLGKSHYAALHYQGVLFNLSVKLQPYEPLLVKFNSE